MVSVVISALLICALPIAALSIGLGYSRSRWLAWRASANIADASIRICAKLKRMK